MKESGRPADSNNSDDQELYTLGYESEVMHYIQSRTAEKEARFFLPHLRSGMSLLDCGCGPGTITAGLADAVSPGNVVGIDMDAGQIEFARSNATARGITNVRFETGSVYELPFPDNSFDAVFANALLHHLGEPVRALVEMRRVLKPNGVIAVRAEDRGADLLEPATQIIVDATSLYMKVWRSNGGDPFSPRRHKAMLREAGFTRVEVSASSLVRGTVADTERFGRLVAHLVLEQKFATVATEAGWVDRPTLERMNAAFVEWGKHPDAFQLETWCEAIGWND